MTEMDARRFLYSLTEDPSLRTELRSTGAEAMDDLVDFAFAKGFVFTQQELSSALSDFSDNPFVNELRERIRSSGVAHSR